jgi:hypothetical protein
VYPKRCRRQVRREILILAELDRLLPELSHMAVETIWDCQVPGGCSLRRPDALFVLEHLGFYLQFEVDEDGHRSYSCIDEDVRTSLI